MTGMGGGDADGVEVDEEWRFGYLGVLRQVLGVSLAFLNKSSSEYFKLSLGVVARSGPGSTSCPADRDLRELVECEGTGSSL